MGLVAHPVDRSLLLQNESSSPSSRRDFQLIDVLFFNSEASRLLGATQERTASFVIA